MNKDQSTKLIKSEEKRLIEARLLEKLRENKLCRYLTDQLKISLDKIINAFHNSDNASTFATRISTGAGTDSTILKAIILNLLSKTPSARSELNDARAILGLDRITEWDIPLSSEIDDSLLHNRESREREKRELTKTPNTKTR